MAESDLSTLTPTFIIYINGTRISVDQEAAVKRVTIYDRLNTAATASIVLSDSKRQWTDSTDFAEGNLVSIELGYKDDVAETFSGEIIGHSGSFQRGGDSLLTVKCSTVLHRLSRAKKTTTYVEKTDKEILDEMVSAAGLSLKADDVTSERPYVTRKGMTDLDFLFELARRNGCYVWTVDKEIHVMKTLDRSSEDVVIEWGKTLLDFSVDNDCRKLFTEVEVRGWNHEKGEVIVGTANAQSLTKKIGGDTPGAQIVSKNFCDAKVVLFDQEVLDESSAEDLATQMLQANSMNYCSAEGKAEGNYQIIAGAIVVIKEAGDRFSGSYLVQQVRHQFDVVGGYVSSFALIRNAV